MLKNIKNIAIIILILLLGFFIYDKFTPEEKEVEVPVKIDVPVPSKEGESDTIKNPIPVKEITIENPINKKLAEENKRLKKQNKKYINENKELLVKYQEADSISKEKIYKNALTIREYEEKYIDSVQTITVNTKTRGEMLEQSISYKTEEYTIPLDTTVTTKIKQPFKVYGSLEIGTDIFNDNRFESMIVKPGIEFQNSKDFSITISGDTEGRGWLGTKIKF